MYFPTTLSKVPLRQIKAPRTLNGKPFLMEEQLYQRHAVPQVLEPGILC